MKKEKVKAQVKAKVLRLDGGLMAVNELYMEGQLKNIIAESDTTLEMLDRLIDLLTEYRNEEYLHLLDKNKEFRPDWWEFDKTQIFDFENFEDFFSHLTNLFILERVQMDNPLDRFDYELSLMYFLFNSRIAMYETTFKEQFYKNMDFLHGAIYGDVEYSQSGSSVFKSILDDIYDRAVIFWKYSNRGPLPLLNFNERDMYNLIASSDLYKKVGYKYGVKAIQ